MMAFFVTRREAAASCTATEMEGKNLRTGIQNQWRKIMRLAKVVWMVWIDCIVMIACLLWIVGKLR